MPLARRHRQQANGSSPPKASEGCSRSRLKPCWSRIAEAAPHAGTSQSFLHRHDRPEQYSVAELVIRDVDRSDRPRIAGVLATLDRIDRLPSVLGR